MADEKQDLSFWAFIRILGKAMGRAIKSIKAPKAPHPKIGPVEFGFISLLLLGVAATLATLLPLPISLIWIPASVLGVLLWLYGFWLDVKKGDC